MDAMLFASHVVQLMHCLFARVHPLIGGEVRAKAGQESGGRRDAKRQRHQSLREIHRPRLSFPNPESKNKQLNARGGGEKKKSLSDVQCR